MKPIHQQVEREFKPRHCRTCKVRFVPTNGYQRYCCKECQVKGELVTKKCKRCGKEFEKRRSSMVAHCSLACSKKTAGETRRKNHPTTIVCPGCNQKFTKEKPTQRHCSHACATKMQHENRRKTTGAHPKWGCKSKGEDNCRVCGYPATHLHHIVPRSKTKLGHRDMRNGLPLCRGCHYGWHHNTVVIYSDRLTDEEREFAMEISSEWWVTHRYPPRPYDPDNLDGVSFEEQAQIVDDCGGISVALPPESRDRYLTNNRRD